MFLGLKLLFLFWVGEWLLNSLSNRLGKKGNLYDFNDGGVSSSAINKYMEFIIEYELYNLQFYQNEIFNKIKKLGFYSFSNEPQGNLDFPHKNLLLKGGVTLK